METDLTHEMEPWTSTHGVLERTLVSPNTHMVHAMSLYTWCPVTYTWSSHMSLFDRPYMSHAQAGQSCPA
eukprot:1157119-Pelagomonas_calceolata.AAC.2